VLRHIAEGCTCRQIAHRMGVTTHTVDTYLRRIKAKSGMTTKAELLAHLDDIAGTPVFRGATR